MAVGMSGGNTIKQAINAPELPVADDDLSTDEGLDALANEFESSPPPRRSPPKQSRSAGKSSASDNTKPKFPSYDDLDDSDQEFDEPSLDDAADSDVGDDDETDDEAERQALADAYGLDVEQLSGFSTAKDAEAALALMDAQFSAAQRQQQGNQQQWDPQWQPVQQQPTQQQPAQQQIAAQLAELELQLEEWDKDDPLAKNFSAIKGAINPMVKEVQFLRQAVVAMYRESAQREQAQREQQFHATLDRLNPKLFGTVDKATPLQRRYRERMAEEFNILEAGYASNGRQIPPMEDLIGRVMRSAFANQLAKDQRNQPQSNGKPGRPRLGTPGRGRSRKDSGRGTDWDGEFEDNPVLHRLYDQFAEASGNS